MTVRDTNASWLSSHASSGVVFGAGAALLPAFLLQQNLAIRALLFGLFLVLNILSGRRLRLLQYLLVGAGIVLFNLVIREGRVLVTVLGLPLTEGALKSGLIKATAMIGLIALSQFSVRSVLRIPGRFGGILGASLLYFERIMGEKRSIDRKDIVGSVDAILLSVHAEPPGRDAASPRARTSIGAAAVLLSAVLLSWGALAWTLIQPHFLWGDEVTILDRLLGGRSVMEALREFIVRSLRLAFDLRSWRAGMKALRIPSLVIAAASCGLGVVLAWRDGRGNLLNAAAVMITGLALQAGVNLVNDFFEFRQRRVDDKVAHLGFPPAERELLEVLIFLVGLALFGLAGLVGLFLAWRSGWGLLVLGLLGFAGGFFYTGEPLNYKRHGLAVPLVFFLMGVFMVTGSYAGVTGTVSVRTALQSVPLSILVSAILLGNEIRDFEADTRYGIRTLAVRIGYGRAVALFCVLAGAAYAGSVVLWCAGLFPSLRLLPFALPAAVPPVVFMRLPAGRRGPLIPLVMLHHLAFGALFCLSWFT